MSWRDRATPVGDASSGGSWRDRAVPVESAPDGDYWEDVRKNAMTGLSEAPAAATSLADTATKVASMASPYSMTKSIFQAAGGTPPMQTDVGQGAQAGMDVLKSAPGAVWQGIKDTGKVAMAPFEMAGGTPMGQTSMGRTFRERPLGMTANVAGTLFPLAKGTSAAFREGRAVFAGAEPNFLEAAGAKGINSTLGIRPKTLESMTPRGQNPGQVGVNVGMNLAEEGAAGLSPMEGYSHALKKLNEHGKSVQTALENIKTANSGLGVYPELEDALKVESNRILKPFLDRANELRDSSYPADKFESRYQKAAYNSLAKKAEGKGGFIELDDVKDEMRKVGKMMKSAGEQHLPVIKKLYAGLADIQDSMVQDIAERAGDPKLATNLLQANANYSRYARILPDIKKAASREGVGTSPLFEGEPMKAVGQMFRPTASKISYKAGKAVRKLFTKGPEGKPFDARRTLRNERGSIGPVQQEPPTTIPSNEAEQAYRAWLDAYNKHTQNYDFQNALMDKWGMLKNNAGNY